MADQSGAQWLDLLEEDIPVVDKSGKQLLVKGLDFVDAQTAPAAASAPAVAPVAPVAAGPLPAAPAPAAAPVAIAVGVQASAPKPLEAQPTNTRGDFGLDPEKDAADLKKIEAIMKAKTGAGETEVEKKAEVTLLDKMVDAAVTETGSAFADEDMRKRYRMLISLYFRDLRDLLETKSKFTMPVQSGGMGMSDADADAAMDKLRAKSAEYHAALTGKATDDKAKYVAERTEKVLGAQETAEKADQDKREEAFAGLMQRSGVSGAASGQPGEPAPAPAAKEPKVVPVVGLDAAGKPMAAVKVAAPAPQPAVPTSAPKAAAPVVPAPPQPSAAPAMADVKFTPKLTGPVEELRVLTLKDFRRLSRDPREATLKLKDKIDLLEEQAFDVKTQGIKAWQDSEVNKLYLDILRKSLEGKPINDVIAEREAKGELSLSKAEFDAIMELNRKLRFG